MTESEEIEPKETRPVAVPASLFSEGPEPPFVLFDSRGRVADRAIARTVYVAPSDAEALERFLRANLPRIAGSRLVAEPARAWVLHRVLLAEAEAALEALPRPGALARVLPVIETAAGHVAHEPGVYLAEAARTGASGATHAVATALHALMLAAAEGIDDQASLVQFALAGVFADASMFGARAASEQAHPEQSAELLARAGVRVRGTLDAVRLHHERWDGNGYPRGLRGEAIAPEARILRVADAYAGLTANRPGAPGLRGYEALLHMAQASGEFEPRLLRSYVRALGKALSVNARWVPTDERGTQAEASGAA